MFIHSKRKEKYVVEIKHGGVTAAQLFLWWKKLCDVCISYMPLLGIIIILLVFSAKYKQEEYSLYTITKLFYENILQDSVHDLRFSIVCHFGNLLKETNKQNQERYHAAGCKTFTHVL